MSPRCLFVLLFMMAGMLRGHDGLDLPPPVSAPEAWNVISLCRANLDKLAAEAQWTEMPAQVALIIQSARYLRESSGDDPAREEGLRMDTNALLQIYIFVLAGFVGYQVITKVPALLHTPLMSATNAISGISLVGSIVVAGHDFSLLATIYGLVAVTAATINVVGGFMITDRMLRMFRRKEKPSS